MTRSEYESCCARAHSTRTVVPGVTPPHDNRPYLRWAGVTRELVETQGQRAVIRMRDGKMKVEAESMTMREVRAP